VTGRVYRLRFGQLLMLLTILAAPQAVSAGTGTYKDGSPDLIDLHVMFMYDEATPSDWEPLFKEASKLLFNATEGQVKLGKVVVYNNCPQAADKADVKIYTGNDRADAHAGSLGTPGLRIKLTQVHKTVTTSGSGNRGQLGLVHEMGHYAFGLLDEYLDKSGKVSSSAYCIDQTGTNASVMDAGTTVNIKNQRHEFCWAGNHRAGHTRQCQSRPIGNQTFEDTDSWTWLAAFVKDRYGATLTVPTADPVDSLAGYGADPQIEYQDCGLRSVVCIDRSGSMAALAPLRAADGAGPYEGSPLALSAANLAPIDLAKQGAGNFLQLLQDGDRAAVTSFSDTATTNYAMNAMTAANKPAALAAIAGLQASGSTNIGGGLQVSLQQILGDGAAIANEVVVLLSDGMHNTGTHPDSVLPALKQRGVAVHTIGLGQVDAALMSRIARETGGTYLFAATAAELNAHYLSVLSAIRSQGVLEAAEMDIAAGEDRSLPVFVDSFTAGAAAELLLAWNDPSIEMGFTLSRPDGSPAGPSDPGVTFEYDPSRAFKKYRVTAPAAGSWTVHIENPGAAASRTAFQVHSSASDVTLSGDAGTDLVDFPEPLRIRAGVTTDHAVGGARVEAIVTRPQGPPVRLRLYDDGEAVHGDDAAQDGLYSALFRGFSGDGSYTIEISADTQGAVTVDPGEDGGTFQSEPVDRFIRRKSFSVVLQGMNSVDGDRDGVVDADEDGAPNFGDGNGDGLLDADQSGVASLDRATDGGKVTLIASGIGCNQLTGVTSGLPSPPPEGIDLPSGVFGFLFECAIGRAELVFHGAPGQLGDVYRYGPTPDNPVPHWYNFDFDGTTGAEIAGNRVILHLVDGQRGDDDLVANGIVVVGQAGVSELLATGIPTLSSWAMIVLVMGLAGLALLRMSRLRRGVS
jgi:hypothetical protein